MRTSLAIALSIMWVMLATVALADVATVTLDAGTIPDGVVCDQTWMEANVTLAFVPQAPEDCSGGGPCLFGVHATGVDLYPGRLRLTFALLGGMVTAAEADVIDFCGLGCTKIFLYNGNTIVASASNTTVGVLETLQVSAGGNPVDRCAVSSCEGPVEEVRITFEPTLPTEEQTWGAIKALFDY